MNSIQMCAFTTHELGKRVIIDVTAMVAASFEKLYIAWGRLSGSCNLSDGRFQLGRLQMPRNLDLTGQRFGRLVVIERCGTSKEGQKIYRCKCDCGNEKEITSGNLRHGHTQSCGCINREITAKRNRDSAKHGGCGTRIYRIWYDMRRRCSYDKSINWHLYGGRGIGVCGEWEASFEAFRDWALANGYDDSLTLDRIDNDGDYCPDNCRWATKDEQNANKRTCVYVTIDGVTKTVTEWCKETGVNRMVAYKRIKNGWEPQRAVTEEARR